MRTQSLGTRLLVVALGTPSLVACSDDEAARPADQQPDASVDSPVTSTSPGTDTGGATGETSRAEPTQTPTSTDDAAHHSRGSSSGAYFDAGERLASSNVTEASSQPNGNSSDPQISVSSDASVAPPATNLETVDASTPRSSTANGSSGEPADGGFEEELHDGGLETPARLVVADPEAWALYIYDIPSLELVGQIDGVHFAEHAGFVPLADGRVLFADDESYTLNIHDVFGPIPGDLRLMAPLALPPVHLAVDPAQRYAAVSGTGLNGGPDTMTLVDLQSPNWDTVYASIPSGEPGVLLGGDPLLLYHRNDDPPAMETYGFEALWSGQVAPLSHVGLGTAPHAEVIAHAVGKLFSAADEGIYVITANGAELSEPRVISYAASGRSGGRSFYGRLSSDGGYIYSYIRNDGENHDLGWRDWTNDALIVDVRAETAVRVEVGNGLVYRLAESSRFAVFAQYHPDGDFAHFLDTDRSSPTFHTIVGSVPLPAMSDTPTGTDATPWEARAFRLTGILPSGRYAFVTHGGDGKISVIDTDTMTLTSTITTPTPLNYGGYLLGMERGARTTDTSGR